MRDPDEPKGDPDNSPPMDDQPTTPLDSPQSPGGFKESARTPTTPRALEQRYEILSEAGRGGMGIVYRARDRETGEVVALKILKPEIAADAAIIERFKNELRLARKITHKHVCRIHEFNRAADGTAYISMEFVDGDSLRHILKRFGGMGLRTGIRIAQQICDGLHEAHAQGVVHRDLKPENVMLDQAGNVKVMDFGIARSLESATATTTVLGTPAYMAPEQAEGKPLDHRTDIYALGLILYEMFTGAMAFTGDTPAAIVYRHVHDTPSSPRELEAAIPDHVEKAILKCLEKNPAKRFQSVDELAAALTQEPETKLAPAEGASEEIVLPPRLSAWQQSDWGLLASAAIGLVVFFALFYRFHPASAMKVTVNDEEQKQIARELFKKLNWNVEIGKSELAFYPPNYYEWASNAGDPVARRMMGTEHPVGISGWNTELKVLAASGERSEGSYHEITTGKVDGVWLRWQNVSPDSKPGPQPDAAAMAQMRELAQSALSSIMGSDASVKPSEKARWDSSYHRWVGVIEWRLPLEPKGVYENCRATVDGPRLLNLSCYPFPYDVTGWSTDYDAFFPPLRYFPSGAAMLFLALILFLVRKVYGQPRSRPSLCLAALVGAVFAWMAFPFFVGPETLTGPGGAFLVVVIPILTFCIILLMTYAGLNTVQYYMHTRFPAYAAGYPMLFTKRALEPPAGLAVLRGILVSAAFCGLWMAVISVTGVWGKGLAGMLFWLHGYGGFIQTATRMLHMSSPIPRIFPTVLFFEILVVGFLLIALPLSLLGKASTRARVLLAALAALWVALGFSLAGPMAFPRIAYYVVAAAQAVFLGSIFLRYGLLSALSAIFTVETILLAFPLLEIFQHVDPLPYAIPIALWFVLLALSAGISFRPQVVGAYRRVAAVFE